GAQAPNEVLPTPSTPWKTQRFGSPAPAVTTSASPSRLGLRNMSNLLSKLPSGANTVAMGERLREAPFAVRLADGGGDQGADGAARSQGDLGQRPERGTPDRVRHTVRRPPRQNAGATSSPSWRAIFRHPARITLSSIAVVLARVPPRVFFRTVLNP